MAQLWLIAALSLAPHASPLFEGKSELHSKPITNDAASRFRSFTARGELPDTTGEAVLVDRSGRLWFGTQAWVAFHDGKKWRHLPLPSPTVSKYVSSLAELNDGSLAIGTLASGAFVFGKDGSWRELSASASQKLQSDNVRVVWANPDGKRNAVWVGNAQGLAGGTPGDWRLIPSPRKDAAVTALTAEEGDTPRFVGTTQGLYELQGDRLVPVAIKLPDQQVRSLLLLGDILWVGTEKGLVRFSISTQAMLDVPKSLTDVQIPALTALRRDGIPQSVWIATYGRGVASFDGKRFVFYGKRRGLNGLLVRSVAAPLNGEDVYAGHDDGLDVLNAYGWKSFGDEAPAALHERSWMLRVTKGDKDQDEVWVSRTHELARIVGERITLFRAPKGGAEDTVFGLTQRRDGSVWVGTERGELGVVRGDQIVRAADIPPPRQTIWSLAEDNGGGLWLGRKVSLLRLDDKGLHTLGESEGLPSQFVWAVSPLEAQRAGVWAGTQGGIARYENGKFTVQSVKTGFPYDLIASFFLQGRRTFVATQGGGVVLLGPDDKPKAVWSSQNSRIPDDFIDALTDDKQGRLYLQTNRGVARLSLSSSDELLGSQAFTESDGLPSSECSWNSIATDTQGRIWASTVSGVAVFDPSDEVAAPPAALAQVVKTTVNGTLALTPGALLTHDQNNMRFEFAVNDYHRPKDLLFRSQLDGLDKAPTPWSTEDRRDFTTLPPGDYAFKLWARNARGVESAAAPVLFVVRPAPWQTVWAYAAYALLMSLAAVGTSRWRTAALTQRAKQLELKVTERTHALQEKTDQLALKNNELESKNVELAESQRQADRIFAALAEAMPGKIMDAKYKLGEMIGEGGFGVVYKATEVRTGKLLAIKVFRPQGGNDSVESLERFRQEGKTVAMLDHPNTIKIFGSGVSEDNIAYMAMELLQGESLSDLLKREKKMSIVRAATIALEAASALSAAHAMGIVHRDIKPENIFLHKDGGKQITKVLDFGIAKLRGSGMPNMSLTMTGAVVGTPAYIAPERLDDREYTGTSDVYSLAICLYEMLVGRPPFLSEKNNIFSVVTAHLSTPPPPLTKFDATIPLKLQDVVLAGLEKDPEHRPSAQKFADDLRPFATG